MSKFTIEELNNISEDFYKIFQKNTTKSYQLNKELQKYVIHAIYTFDCAHKDCELTFEDWCIKYNYTYERK